MWGYVEHRRFDCSAIEDVRLCSFEGLLRRLKHGFPPEGFEAKVPKHVALMDRWYRVPHWAVDRERLCFVEVGDSRQYAGDGDMTESEFSFFFF